MASESSLRHRLRGLRSIAQEAGQYLNGVRCNQLKTASAPVMVQGRRARARLNKPFQSPLPDRGRLVASEHHIPKEAQNPSDGKQHIGPPSDNCLGLNVTNQPDGADPTGWTVQPLCQFTSSLVPTGELAGDGRAELPQWCPTGGCHDKQTAPSQTLPLPRSWDAKDPEVSLGQPGSPNRCFSAPCGRCGPAGQRGVRCASGCNNVWFRP